MTTESKCPFHNAQQTQSGTTNRDWWPTALRVDLLEQPLAAGQTLEVKLFLNGTDGAVYFLTTVLDSVLQEQAYAITDASEQPQPATQYLIQSVVSRIRDEDREVLVRASLHEQSRQLKTKARLRQSQGNV